MAIFSEIENLRPYFYGIRLHDEYFIVDLNVPSNWAISEMYGKNVASKINGVNKDNTQSVSLFSSYNSTMVNEVFKAAKLILKVNLEREEKERLLEIKRLELEKMFMENNLESLKNMSFTSLNKKNTLSDDEKLRIKGLVQEGTEPGPDGNSKPQEGIGEPDTVGRPVKSN